MYMTQPYIRPYGLCNRGIIFNTLITFSDLDVIGCPFYFGSRKSVLKGVEKRIKDNVLCLFSYERIVTPLTLRECIKLDWRPRRFPFYLRS